MKVHQNETGAWWDSSQAIRCPIMQLILLHFEYGRIMALRVSWRHNKVSWYFISKVRMMLTQLWKKDHEYLRGNPLSFNRGTFCSWQEQNHESVDMVCLQGLPFPFVMRPV
jgi:hypothetical protein